MAKQHIDQPFNSEQDARLYAGEKSAADKIKLYIILTGDQYFVSASNRLQPYETLIDTYH